MGSHPDIPTILLSSNSGAQFTKHLRIYNKITILYSKIKL